MESQLIILDELIDHRLSQVSVSHSNLCWTHAILVQGLSTDRGNSRAYRSDDERIDSTRQRSTNPIQSSVEYRKSLSHVKFGNRRNSLARSSSHLCSTVQTTVRESKRERCLVKHKDSLSRHISKSLVIDYKYRLQCPDSFDYDPASYKLQLENLELFPWNQVDNVVINQGFGEHQLSDVRRKSSKRRSKFSSLDLIRR